jgi:hypothetical protein
MQARGDLGDRVSRFVQRDCLAEVHSPILAAFGSRLMTVLTCDVRPIEGQSTGRSQWVLSPRSGSVWYQRLVGEASMSPLGRFVNPDLTGVFHSQVSENRALWCPPDPV